MEDYLQFANPSGHVFRAPIQFITEQDARLITASPDLLAAAQLLISSASRGMCYRNKKERLAFDKFRAAIAKAEGGAL